MLNPDKIDWHFVDSAVKKAHLIGIRTNRVDVLKTMVDNGMLHHDGVPTVQAIHDGTVIKRCPRHDKAPHQTYLRPERSYYLMLATVLECFDTVLHQLNATDVSAFGLPRTIELLKSRALPNTYHLSDWSNLLFASYLLYDEMKQADLDRHDVIVLKTRFDIVCNRFMQFVKAEGIALDDGLDIIQNAIILERELG